MIENEMTVSVPLEVVKASEIEPKEVKWLWYPYIPVGKVTLLQGDPGDGKSKLKFDQLVRDITKAVILPRAMDTKGSPRSLLRGEKEHPRSGEPFDACGKSGKRSAV